MNTKPNKENIVTQILLELEKGTERAKCLAKVGKKLQLSNRTFDRHWKTANERYAVNQEAKQKALAEVSLEGEKERLKKAILTKDAALELLSKIAQDKLTRDNDKISAVKTMADMEGWKAPIKQEHSGEIKTNLSALTTEELIARAKAIKKLNE